MRSNSMLAISVVKIGAKFVLVKLVECGGGHLVYRVMGLPQGSGAGGDGGCIEK